MLLHLWFIPRRQETCSRIWNVCKRSQEPSADDVINWSDGWRDCLPGDCLWVLVALAGSWVGLILEREVTGQGDDWAVQGREASRGNAARQALEDELPSASAKSWRQGNSCKQKTCIKKYNKKTILSFYPRNSELQIVFFIRPTWPFVPHQLPKESFHLNRTFLFTRRHFLSGGTHLRVCPVCGWCLQRCGDTLQSISSIAEGWDFLLLLSKVADGSDWQEHGGNRSAGSVGNRRRGERIHSLKLLLPSVSLFYHLHSKERRIVKVQHGQTDRLAGRELK